MEDIKAYQAELKHSEIGKYLPMAITQLICLFTFRKLNKLV